MNSNNTQRRTASGTRGTTAGRSSTAAGRSRSGSIKPEASSRRTSSGTGRRNAGSGSASKRGNDGFSYKYERDRRSSSGGSTAVESLVKAIIYIVLVLVVSSILGYFAISISNDAFAFIKSGEDMTVTVTEKMNTDTLGEFLYDNGFIKYKKMFDIYTKIRYGSELEFDVGEYTAASSMSYDELIAVFAKSQKAERTTVIAVIPEGYTVKQIINTLVDKYGLSSREELTDAIENYDFDYWFVKELSKDKVRSGRKYRLEGYLYPDTYYYYSDAKASTIIYKMLDNFDKKMKQVFGKDYQNTTAEVCKRYNMTFDDMITIASMVQMEAKFEEDYPGISEVFHNRLKNPKVTNGKLQSDATIQYFLEKRTADLSGEQLSIDDPYNTYIYEGLPPGPITNPTFGTIHFAFYPDNEGNYYFITDTAGYAHFAKNLEQHRKNIAEYLKKK